MYKYLILILYFSSEINGYEDFDLCSNILHKISVAADVDQLILLNGDIYPIEIFLEVTAEHQKILEKYFESGCEWPKDDLDGSHNLWILIQHSGNIDWQLNVGLPAVQGAANANLIEKKTFALLQDRVLINADRPQRYGTQGHCEDGVFTIMPMEDAAIVDELRASVGLSSLQDYIDTVESQFCVAE